MFVHGKQEIIHKIFFPKKGMQASDNVDNYNSDPVVKNLSNVAATAFKELEMAKHDIRDKETELKEIAEISSSKINAAIQINSDLQEKIMRIQQERNQDDEETMSNPPHPNPFTLFPKTTQDKPMIALDIPEYDPFINNDENSFQQSQKSYHPKGISEYVSEKLARELRSPPRTDAQELHSQQQHSIPIQTTDQYKELQQKYETLKTDYEKIISSWNAKRYDCF